MESVLNWVSTVVLKNLPYFPPFRSVIGANWSPVRRSDFERLPSFGNLIFLHQVPPTPTFEVPSLRVSWLEQKFIICSSFCIAIVYVSIGEETFHYGFRGKSISADVHGVSTSCELLNWDCSTETTS